MMPTMHTPPGGHPWSDDPVLRLAEQLKRAWVGAGRPSMGEVGDHVGYSKASISKVLAGKMAPAWHLVRKLGAELGVPDEIVQTEWHSLWAAADEWRRLRPADPTPADQIPAEPRLPRQATDERRQVGAVDDLQQCGQCGSWVADPQVHQVWHGQVDVAETPPNLPEAYRWADLRDAVRGRDARNAQPRGGRPDKTARNAHPYRAGGGSPTDRG